MGGRRGGDGREAEGKRSGGEAWAGRRCEEVFEE
jgi:hypothetical protein